MIDPSSSSIVSKCARFIDILTDAQRPFKFREFMDTSSMSKSTTHRLFKVLLGEEWIELDKISRIYHSGLGVIVWGQAPWKRPNLQSGLAVDQISISEPTKMNVALSILDTVSILLLTHEQLSQSAPCFALR